MHLGKSFPSSYNELLLSPPDASVFVYPHLKVLLPSTHHQYIHVLQGGHDRGGESHMGSQAVNSSDEYSHPRGKKQVDLLKT